MAISNDINKTLSKKHSLVIDEYISNGYNGTAAYLAVYKGVTVATAHSNSCMILNSAKAKEIIAAHQAQLNKISLITREEIILDLIKIKNTINTDNKNSQQALKAIEILNKMLGFNEPERTDVTTNGHSINDINVIIIKPNQEKQED